MILKLKQSYLAFLEKEQRNFPEVVLFYWLCALSYIYGLIVALRNFLYDKNFLPALQPQAKVISIGSLSWAGSGKTSLALWLLRKLSADFKTAILRRGYGRDEECLLKEESQNVFSDPNRCCLVKNLAREFELFIVDDGFQYRKLKRDLNLVLVGSRELRRKARLLPAYFFREPFSALKRADIIVITYADELPDRSAASAKLKAITPDCALYFSQYRFKQLSDLTAKPIGLVELQNKKLAAFCAIGYPEGFFRKLKETGLEVLRQITYPDHYQLSEAEYHNLEEELLAEGVNALIITAKDKYHFPAGKPKLNILVMEVELQIEEEDAFLKQVKSYLHFQ